MGFNTAIIVRNDFLHEIKSDPMFGEKVYREVVSGGRNSQYSSSFSVLPSAHADTAQVVVIAANSIRPLGFGYWTQDDVALLRALADQHGYRLHRKSSR